MLRPLRVLSFLGVLAATACGGGGAGDGEISGEVVVSGSSTVEPITALNGEKFVEENPGVAFRVDGPGTGDGFQLFCDGETDISDASRPIKDQEIQKCADNDVEYVELKVGIDGLSVITSPENDAVECLAFGDLYALLGPESEGFDRWSDGNELATEVGGNDDFPDAPLVITAPGEESGTYDSFVELALEDIAEERGQDPLARKDYESSPNDNVVVEGIAGNDTSLGWAGYAFVVENLDQVKPLPVDGGDGCVEPSAETIAGGTYPLARPLFIYVNTAAAAESEAVAAFVDFYLSEEGRASVSEVGYVELTDAEWDATASAWAAGRPAGPDPGGDRAARARPRRGTDGG
ncbi:MAG: phosphate ABC transporter substrate-binding protein PstS family protein [Acidimicrobiia bacterium]|nr:phosphate ABC transporter substrate-binding protein PstS family protein [Acidimicrobiia bacterium]